MSNSDQLNQEVLEALIDAGMQDWEIEQAIEKMTLDELLELANKVSQKIQETTKQVEKLEDQFDLALRINDQIGKATDRIVKELDETDS